MPGSSLDAASRTALAGLLAAPRWEVLPLPSSLKRVSVLPPGATITVTASPGKPIEATVDLARGLKARGFAAVPHLAARMVRDRRHLRGLVESLRDGGIESVFVIGGDADALGVFPDAISLLRELSELDHPFGEVGIGVHPQGHPFIPAERLEAALTEKAPHASYMTTQICFDVAALRMWLLGRRAAGVTLPVHIGIPGVLQAHRLLEISARIGVVDAGRFVRSHGALVRRLLGPRGYRPERLLADLAPLMTDPVGDVRQLHLYTFNQVGPTMDWLDHYRARLAPDALAARGA